MYVYIIMGYGAALVVLGVVSNEGLLVLFGLALLMFSNLHNLAEILKRRRENDADGLR